MDVENNKSKRESETQKENSNMPQKRHYRSRASLAQLCSAYPASSSLMRWDLHYPDIPNPVVRFIDIGCGFGGLTVGLSALYPDKLVLGMEIRAKVCEYVRLRIEALRREHPGQYHNAACLRTNCMRYLPNFLIKGQLEKIFICFPDPHFKAKNHRRRIVTDVLLSEYAHFLGAGGKLYVITDVEELHLWHRRHCDSHPMFRAVSAEAVTADPAVALMLEHTEEGKKVARLGGRKHFAVYERISDQEAESEDRLILQHLWKEEEDKAVAILATTTVAASSV